MLTRIQDLLVEFYDLNDLSPERNVERFVCGPETLRAAVGEGPEDRGEVLLVFEDQDGLHLGLYLDPDVLAALRAGNADFRAQCLATEGVSHFLYLTFRADNAEQVTQLELELQAEVDKYAAGLAGVEALSGYGVGAIRARSRYLRERLFRSPRFLDAPETAEGERYRLAHRAAARYTGVLEERFVRTGRLEELRAELRRFYRLGAREKLEHAGA